MGPTSKPTNQATGAGHFLSGRPLHMGSWRDAGFGKRTNYSLSLSPSLSSTFCRVGLAAVQTQPDAAAAAAATAAIAVAVVVFPFFFFFQPDDDLAGGGGHIIITFAAVSLPSPSPPHLCGRRRRRMRSFGRLSQIDVDVFQTDKATKVFKDCAGAGENSEEKKS